ncbi:S-type pyocin domain-containing protein [Ectopseudomonas khazarica]|uniref:S-type pyocin domain-containing protein n=1 Tax=Ectopseudomonas khazarica TaxID=2502979 RepID=UPI00106E0A75|nr:S-type pyocin domain-containing protein [Pseudomonas khazarica]
MPIELPPMIVTPRPPIITIPKLPEPPPYVAKPLPIHNVVDDFGNISIKSWHPQYSVSVIAAFMNVIHSLTASINSQVAGVSGAMDERIRSMAIDNGDAGETLQSLEREVETVDSLLGNLRRELSRQTALVRPEFRVSNLADKTNAVHAYNRISRDRKYTSGTPNQAYKIWSASYRAQSMEALINKEIAYLEGKKAGIKSEISRIKNDPDFASKQAAANTYSATVAMGSATPFVVAPSGIAAVAGTAELALKEAVARAVERLAAAGVATTTATIAVFAVLMGYSPRLGDASRQTLSTPLTDIYQPGGDLQELALQGGELDVPWRLAFKELGGYQQIYMAPTGGVVPRGVKVRAASFDSAAGGYSFQTNDSPPRTLVWTPIVDPDDSSTVLPPVDTDIPNYTGPVLHPVDPVLEVFPSVGDVPFDDYVIVFPADSGIEPIYIVFRNRREERGVAKGFGENVTGAWLPTAGSEIGAAVPSQIADRLRGRQFESFDRMREAIWTEVGLDPKLSAQVSAQQKQLMLRGRSPYAPLAEQVGGRVKYELHHIEPIGIGGAVYDLDNIRIVTPKRHIEIHSNKEGS